MPNVPPRTGLRDMIGEISELPEAAQGLLDAEKLINRAECTVQSLGEKTQGKCISSMLTCNPVGHVLNILRLKIHNVADD
jgi:hypothetical protein